MAYEPLHHKYRPQTFADLVGQEAIATTLTSAILQARIAPAYLFSGPRGTGKTSSARILAKSLNCQSGDRPTPRPCGVCEACRSIVAGNALDVIEIDAASNTGVDNIRELIEKAQFAPVQCRFKVYVIDECHMLSTAAFNALLKTLEEPPDRVVFVLATTDPQRVLPTIISRCQRFDYRRIPLESMVSHLRFIADQEAIEIEPEALTLVAQISQGGLRDAESLLDQLSLLPPPIRVEAVWDLVGAVPERDLLTLVEAIAANDPETVIDRARQLMNRGREPLIVLQNLASFYRDLLIAKTAPQRSDLVAITPGTWKQMVTFVQSSELTTLLQGQQHLRASEVQLKNTTQPRLWLEVTLLGLLPSAQVAASAPVWAAPPALPSQPGASANSASLADVNSVNGDSVHVDSVKANPIASAPVDIPPSIATTSQVASTPLSSTTPSAHSSTPPPENAAGNSPPPDTASSRFDANTQADLAELWKRVVANVEFRSTQMLLRQQGHLLKLSAKAARVGINDRWVSNLQGKLPAIEAAFAKTLGQPIKVNLEPVLPKPDVLLDPPPKNLVPPNLPTPPAPPIPSHPSPQPPSPQPTHSQAPPPQPPTPLQSHPSPPPAPSQAIQPLPSTQPSTQPAEAVDQEFDSGLSLETQSPNRTIPSPPVPNLPSPNPPSPNPPSPGLPIPSLAIPSLPDPNLPVPSLNAVWDEDELLRAAKSLAQFFNGEVVSPEIDIAEVIDSPQIQGIASLPASETFSPGLSAPSLSSPETLNPNLLEPSFFAEEDDDVPF